MAHLVICILLTVSLSAYACDLVLETSPMCRDDSYCNERYRLAHQYKDSAAVFRATVLSAVRLNRQAWPFSRMTVQIDHVWKTDGGPLDIIESGYGQGDCGIVLKVGRQYIIFAARQSGDVSGTPSKKKPLAIGVPGFPVQISPDEGSSEKTRSFQYMQRDAAYSVLDNAGK